MKTTLLTLLTLLFLSQSVYSQKNKWFKSIEEGLTTPDSVYVLDLRNQNLNEIPIDVREFKNITALYLVGNNIKTLPNWLFDLEKIEILSLGEITFDGYIGNPITELTVEILKLKKLELLDLSGCSIEFLPDFIFKIENLEHLTIAGTKITNLPDLFFFTNHNGRFNLRVDSKQKFDKETNSQLKKMKQGGHTQMGNYKILSLYK
jgi:Leucine-rich repeat (LRR) protein